MMADGKRRMSNDDTDSNDSYDESTVSANSPDFQKESSRSKSTKDTQSQDLSSRKTASKRKASQMQQDDDDDNPDDRDPMISENGHSRQPSGSSTSQVCLCQPEPRVPRPRNAFILYRQHHQAAIVQQNPSLTNPEISKIIGHQWKRQPTEVKNEWQKLAEEEKTRHQQQYPEYRYQPRRGGRRNSTADSPTSTSSNGRCQKCGGRTMVSPTTPNSGSQPPRPMLPPPVPSSSNGYVNSRYIPVMNNMNSASPRNPKSARHIPPGVNVAPLADYQEEERYMQISPDVKRRRYTNGGAYIPVASRPSVGTPYPMMSPYRESFERYEVPARHPHPGTSISAPSTTNHVHMKQIRPVQDKSLTLPPIQTNGEEKKSVEELVMGIDPPRKIRILGRISPPLNTAGPFARQSKTRGAVIAVEGDNEESTTQVARWLEEFLSKGVEYHVVSMEGPEAPKPGKEVTISDYFALIGEWHSKGRDIIEHITTSASHELPNGNTDDRNSKSPSHETNTANPPQPVVLLNRYQLFASNAFACRIPINDVYPPVDHWQWMATMWRSIVGPDVTVYVKDIAADELANEKVVELREDMRCVIVRRQRGSGPLQDKVEEKYLRRLGFELGEWIRSVGQTKKDEQAQKSA